MSEDGRVILGALLGGLFGLVVYGVGLLLLWLLLDRLLDGHYRR